MAEKELFIKEALSEFLQKLNLDASISAVDDIVLSYVVSILEELGSETPSAETFDVADFMEMMEAYIPGFCEIDSTQVFDWVFQLTSNLNSIKENNTEKSPENVTFPCAVKSPPQPVPSTGNSRRKRKTSHKLSDSSPSENGLKNSSPRQNYMQDNDRSHTEDKEDADMSLLLEMFPAACSLEISHCLYVAGGSVEQASQLILDRQQSGESFTSSTPSQSRPRAGVKPQPLLDDKQMKASILNKYSYVDTDEDAREHRPLAAQKHTETKKLVRYLDSQVVTTKGEKFTEIKKDTDVDPKKFNINLKPARQYRFHWVTFNIQLLPLPSSKFWTVTSYNGHLPDRIL